SLLRSVIAAIAVGPVSPLCAHRSCAAIQCNFLSLLPRPTCGPQRAEPGQNVDIEPAHEWCDQLGQLLEGDPSPGVEFRMLGGEVDVSICAGEPHRKPFLPIATIPPAHYPLGNLVRKIMVKPAAALGKKIGVAGADLLSQLTQRRLA